MVQDLVRSIRGLVRRDGTWVMSQQFAPYGEVVARDTNPALTIPTLRYAWTGREYDAELGWYYFRARYYSIYEHRFVQEDPIGHSGGGNLYAYAAGNPLTARDPSGLVMEDVMTTYDIVRGGSCPDAMMDGATVSGCYGGMGGGLVGDLRDAGMYEEYRKWARAAAEAAAHTCESSLSAIGNAGCTVDPDDLEAVFNAVQAQHYVAPDLVRVDGNFYVEMRDQNNNLHTFRLTNPRLHRVSGVSQRRDGAYATYQVLDWDDQESSPRGEVLFWLNFIPIRSQLTGPGPWRNVSPWQFAQVGPARGYHYARVP